MSRRSGFRLLPHTADIGLEVMAASREELFVTAAQGLRHLAFGEVSAGKSLQRRIEVESVDLPALLVAWLNEILYLCESAAIVPADFRIETMNDRQLTATISGEPFDPGRHAVERAAKAVTYHQLIAEERDDGWYARVYIDL